MTDASDLARALAARRQRATYVCAVCGTAFDALVRKTKRLSDPRAPMTCSPKCRQKRYRKEHAAARPT